MLLIFSARRCICLFGKAYGLEASNLDTIDKLNTVSETINEMSRSYKEDSKKASWEDETKKIFMESIEEKLDTIKDNVLYDDLVDENNSLLDNIFEILLEKGYITKENIIELLESRNEYILGFDDFDTNMKIEDEINTAVRLINETYKIGQVNSIWKQKMKTNKKVISSQLDGVSRAISDVARSMNKNKGAFDDEIYEVKILFAQKDIEVLDLEIKQNKNGSYVVNVYQKKCKSEEDCRTYEIENILTKILKDKIVLQREECALKGDNDVCKQIYVSKDRFNLQIGIAQEKKKDSSVSGDSSVQARLDDGKYLIAISDGMGSGVLANEASQKAIKMLSRMLDRRF